MKTMESLKQRDSSSSRMGRISEVDGRWGCESGTDPSTGLIRALPANLEDAGSALS
jgi:hypothetical protein